MGLFSTVYIGSRINAGANEIANSIATSGARISSSIDIASENLSKINNTLDSEFNSKDKRLISIKLEDADGEELKLSHVFNDVPLFKEELTNIFNNTPTYVDNVRLNELLNQINKDTFLSRATCSMFNVPFNDDLSLLDEIPEAIKYNMGNLDFNFTNPNNFVILNWYDNLKKTKEFLNKNLGSNNKIIINKDIIYSQLDAHWEPSNKLKEHWNNILKMVKPKIDTYNDALYPLNASIKSLMKSYLSEGLSFELVGTPTNDKIFMKIKKDDETCYFTCKRAPNVNVTDNKSI